jgi:hypothetical protein
MLTAANARDQRIRHRVLERDAIRRSGAAVFALTAGEATATESAEVVVRLLVKFANMAISEPKPFPLHVRSRRPPEPGAAGSIGPLGRPP